MPKLLPYGRQCIDEADVAAVNAVLVGEFLTTGPAVGSFEQGLKNTIEVPYAVSCANGTAALHLAMLALGVDAGDVVIVPSITFLASANCARFVGADVVFADVDLNTGLITPDSFEDAIRRSPKPPRAAVIVHLNGQTADLDSLSAIAERYRIDLVEDACHALGSKHRYKDGEGWVGDGRRSRISCFSFHPVKTIAAGEGGASTTREEPLARRLELFRNHGMVRDPAELTLAMGVDEEGRGNPWHYEMHEVGFNYRMSDIQCALAGSQLKKLSKFVARRAELVAQYDALIENLKPYIEPVGRAPWCVPAWHLYSVLVDFKKIGKSRSSVMKRLRELGIGTQVHYIPVHQQPYYADRYKTPDLPGARHYFEQQLSLPLFYSMTNDDVRRVYSALRDVLSFQ